MMRLLPLFLLLTVAAGSATTAGAYSCSATNDKEIERCLKNASPAARNDVASQATDDRDSRPARVETPDWLDLHVLEVQLYGADTPAGMRGGEPWLQALRNFPSRNIMLLRSALGPPILVGLSKPPPGGKPEVFVVAHLPENTFADRRCVMPSDTGQIDVDVHDYAPSPPAGVRLLKHGTALAIPLTSKIDLGNGFARVEETEFVQVTSDGLVPLLCVRNHSFQSLTGNWSSDGAAETNVSGDDWTLVVTSDWHDGHADIRAVHVGAPSKTLLFRWSRAAGRYRASD
ncbi:hypothetical protein [Rhizobium binxianense]